MITDFLTAAPGQWTVLRNCNPCDLPLLTLSRVLLLSIMLDPFCTLPTLPKPVSVPEVGQALPPFCNTECDHTGTLLELSIQTLAAGLATPALTELSLSLLHLCHPALACLLPRLGSETVSSYTGFAFSLGDFKWRFGDPLLAAEFFI